MPGISCILGLHVYGGYTARPKYVGNEKLGIKTFWHQQLIQHFCPQPWNRSLNCPATPPLSIEINNLA